MSDIALFKSGASIPDYLRSETDDLTRRLAGSTNKSISIKGGVWRLISGGEEIAKNESRAMNFVVVNAHPHVSRAYYTGTFEEGKADAPACFSADGKLPDPAIKNPQHSDCGTCPQNIAGSGANGSRACRFNQRLAVVLEGDIGGSVYRLQLPAKSIFGRAEGPKMPFQAYAKFLAGHGLPIGGVVTEARFDTNEAVPVLRFTAVRPLTQDELRQSRAQGGTEDAKAAIETKFVPKDAPAALPAPEEPSVPAFSAEPSPAADEEGGTPVVRKSGRKPVAPQQRPSAADIVNEWASDDED